MNTVNVGSMEVASNTDTPEQMRAVLEEPGKTAAPAEEPDAAIPEAEAKEPEAKPSEERERDPDTGKFVAKEAKGAEISPEKSGEKSPEKSGEAPKKDRTGDPRHDPNARVRQALEAKKAAEERAARAEAELQAVRAPKPPSEAAPAAKTASDAAPEDDPEPKLDESPDYETFVDKKARWAARQEWKAQETKREATERTRSFESHVRSRTAVLEKALEDAGGPEFVKGLSDDVLAVEPSFFPLSRGEQPGPFNALADEFLRAGEKAPRLMRYFSEHPDAFQRLSTLRPREFEREMGRIEAKLDAAATAGTPRRVEVSQAKPPVRPVAGSPHTTAEEVTDDMPFRQYVSVMNRKEGKASRW